MYVFVSPRTFTFDIIIQCPIAPRGQMVLPRQTKLNVEKSFIVYLSSYNIIKQWFFASV